MTQNTSHDSTEKKSRLNNLSAAEVVAYVATGVSAILATWLSIGRMFAQKLYDEGQFSEIRTLRSNAYSVLHNRNVGLFDYLKKAKKIENEFNTEMQLALAEKSGIKNTFHKWLALRPHQQIQTGLTFVSILGVAAVAIYSLRKERQRKETKADVQRIETKIEEIKENTTPAEEPAIPAGAKTEAVLKQREAANENAIAL